MDRCSAERCEQIYDFLASALRSNVISRSVHTCEHIFSRGQFLPNHFQITAFKTVGPTTTIVGAGGREYVFSPWRGVTPQLLYMVKLGDVCTFVFLYSGSQVASPSGRAGGIQKAKSAKNNWNHPRLPSVSIAIIAAPAVDLFPPMTDHDRRRHCRSGTFLASMKVYFGRATELVLSAAAKPI